MEYPTEHIVLSPANIKLDEENIHHRYLLQAETARQRFAHQKETLFQRWPDVEQAHQILDSVSLIGAFTLSKPELNTIPVSPLKDFIHTPSSNYKHRFAHHMSLGQQIYLRGEAYYQPFDRHFSPEERLNMSTDTLVRLLQPFPNIQEYIQTHHLSTPELTIYLSYLDHLKIELLRLFHAQTHLEAARPVAAKSSSLIESSVQQSLVVISTGFYSLLDGELPTHLSLNTPSLSSECASLQQIARTKTLAGTLLPDFMRGLPEGDNPIFNKIYAIGLARRIRTINTDRLILAGMHFGGIELPWVVRQEIVKNGQQPPEILTTHFSRYTHKQHEKHNFWQLVDHTTSTNKTLLVIDDGVYSGDSLQTIISLAQNAGFTDILASVQLLANSRQMGRILTAGGVHPDFIDTVLTETIGVSPFFRTRTPADYQSKKELGLFNIIAQRVRSMVTINYPRADVIGKDIFANVRKSTDVQSNHEI